MVDVQSQGDVFLPVDLGIIIALPEEFREFLNILKALKIKYTCQKCDGHYYYLFERQVPNDGQPYQCIVTLIGGMGPTKAGLFTDRLLERWQPATVINIGIAGGIHKDIKAGDVLVADQVDNYFVLGKAVEGGFQHGGEVYRSTWDYIQGVSNLEFAYEKEYKQWLSICRRNFKGCIPENKRDDLLKAGLLLEQVRLMKGHLASGPVVGSVKSFSNWIHERDRNCQGLEMESAGVLEAAYTRTDPMKTLVIRGISDYGDKRKGKLDKIGGGALRRYAMRNAIALLWTILELKFLPWKGGVRSSIASEEKESNPLSPLRKPITPPVKSVHFCKRTDFDVSSEEGIVEKSKPSIDETIDEILAKWPISCYSEREQASKKSEVLSWLDNFEHNEIDDMLLVLEKIEVISEYEIQGLIKKLSGELKKLFGVDLPHVRFFPLGDSPAASGANFLYNLCRELEIGGKCIPTCMPYQHFQKIDMTGIRAMVFIDDIIGSGDQATRFAREKLSDIQVVKYYLALFAFEDGLKKVSEQAGFKKVIAAKTLKEEDKAFSSKSRYFSDPEVRERLKAICRKYGEKLYPGNPLGYEDSQSLLVFPHNVPNNTLPIIWAGPDSESEVGEVWSPVWKRIKIETGSKPPPSDKPGPKSMLEPKSISLAIDALVKEKIKELLDKEKLGPFRQHLINEIKQYHAQYNQDTIDTPSALSEILIALPVLEAITTLGVAVSNFLKRIGEEDPSSHLLKEIWKRAVSILGWLVLRSVDDTWVKENRNNLKNGSVIQFGIPVKTEVGAEVAFARIKESQAKLRVDKDGIPACGQDKIDFKTLEVGFFPLDDIVEVKKCLWKHIFKEDPPHNFTPEDNMILNSTLQTRSRTDDKPRYWIVDALKKNDPLNNKKVYDQLIQDLNALNIIFINIESEQNNQSVLVITERDLDYRIRQFFRSQELAVS